MPADPAEAVTSADELVAVDTALALLVGADPALAREAAVRVQRDWPGLGLMVLGGVAAARWGVDLVPAIARLAEGEALRGSISDYELRFAAEECLDDLEGGLARLAGSDDGPEATSSPGSGVTKLEASHPELSAVAAARDGRRRWQLDPRTTGAAAARVRALAGRLRADLTEGSSFYAGLEVRDPVGAGPAYVGFAALLTS